MVGWWGWSVGWFDVSSRSLTHRRSRRKKPPRSSLTLKRACSRSPDGAMASSMMVAMGLRVCCGPTNLMRTPGISWSTQHIWGGGVSF